MDKDLFESCVRIAKASLSDPRRFLGSTAAQGLARAYLMPHGPRDGGEGFLAKLIEDSREKKSAWDALNLIAQDLLREGEPLPRDLAAWICDVLADQLAPRGQKRRPRPSRGSHRTAGRDWNFYFLVEELIKSGNLQATRNEVSQPWSACDAVAIATGKPYKTVARIWSRCSHQMRKA